MSKNGTGTKVEHYIFGKLSTRIFPKKTPYFECCSAEARQPSLPLWKIRALRNDRAPMRNQISVLRWTIFSPSCQMQLLLTRCHEAFQQDQIVLAHALNRGGQHLYEMLGLGPGCCCRVRCTRRKRIAGMKGRPLKTQFLGLNSYTFLVYTWYTVKSVDFPQGYDRAFSALSFSLDSGEGARVEHLIIGSLWTRLFRKRLVRYWKHPRFGKKGEPKNGCVPVRTQCSLR